MLPLPAPHRPSPPLSRGPAWRCHDLEGEHLHELSADARGVLSEVIWRVDNVELTTVGIDIGSSTSHLMFARVRLQRKTQALSSHFVVIDRQILWRSPIMLTPFLPDNSIDRAALGAFVAGAYADAGLTPAEIDSGAVILTGEAIRRHNAKAIGEMFAADAGKFVCATAGHHLECLLAAHGSGAVALSRAQHCTVLNVDVGGGTSKLAWVRDGTVQATAAIAVGGRLIAFDGTGRITRTDEAAVRAAASLELGGRAAPGAVLTEADRGHIADALADALIEVIRGTPASRLTRALMLSEDPDVDRAVDRVVFSGGVAEYVYGRETRRFGDLAPELALRIAAAQRAGVIPGVLTDTGHGIRATVIGASQFSVQVSGKTIHLPAAVDLPLHNIPVLAPALAGASDAAGIGMAIAAARATREHDPAAPVALALAWHGEPLYAELRVLADGIAAAFADRPPALLVVVVDGDIARTLGYILEREIGMRTPLVAIDGVALRELDYIDIGRVIEPAHVVPVVIKSLLFDTGQRYFRRRSTPIPQDRTLA